MKDFDEKKILLKEYQLCQQSAEHFDKLIWSVVSIVFVAIGAFFAIFRDSDGFITSLFLILNLCLLIGLYFIVAYHSYLKNLKYYRCKEIEKNLLISEKQILKQHSLTGALVCPKKPLISGKTAVYFLIFFLCVVIYTLLIANFLVYFYL